MIVLNNVIVEFTADGYVRMPPEVAERYFPQGVLVALCTAGELWLLPTRGPAVGGLFLKQRNAAGERSVLVREVMGANVAPGPRPARWDEQQGALRIALDAPE
ncbi:MAG: hypothetical protein RMJ56_05110 [Gemmataceae bacterium]|nr:hypothetical protein [Gemmata sp.]MDW8196970.1 hypothetical protein [Gemmataceae bacterium]